MASRDTAERILFLVEILGYVIATAFALSIFGIGLEGILLGGTFSGLILGIAAQTSLSNTFGGITLIIAKPFSVGDRLTMLTWQYSMLAPSYPPKFSSNDFLIPSYTGRVADISLIYTTIITDDNVMMKIPNNIMMQASLFIHEEDYRLVRTKYEVSKTLDPDLAISALKNDLKGLGFIVREPEIKILDTTLQTYVLVIVAFCKGQFEEPPRSEIIKQIMKAIKVLEDAA